MPDDGSAARAYHQHTKHSPQSVRASGHVLDWANQPIPYKLYEDLPAIALPRSWQPSTMPALDAIAAAPPPPERTAPLDLATLARLLHLAAGIVRKVAYANGHEAYFRAAACTGALYHVDLYVVCAALPDLEAGVYHFGPHDFALRRLRSGDHRAVVIDATAAEPAIVAAPAVVISASTYWRNAWKYQARAYRHAYWDDGTILANLLAAAASAAVPARIVLGFVDAMINHLLGVDGDREAALSLVALGHDPALHADTPPPQPALSFVTTPLSAREVDYPAIRAAHAGSTLYDPAEVAAWRANPIAPPSPDSADTDASGSAAAATEPGHVFPLAPLAAIPTATVDEVIAGRGSTRQFAYRTLGFDQLSTLLMRATGDVPADFLQPGAHIAMPYLIVHAVDGLPSGAYVYDRARQALVLLRAGDFRQTAGFLGLGQELPADASVNVYLLADLEDVFARLGSRGYRAAQLEAAIIGGRLYLAAYALGLGATGLTFFDDAVTEFFSPRASGTSVMFLVAIGVPRKRKARASP